VHTGFWCGNLKERDYLEDPRTDGKIILKHLLEVGWECMDWIDFAQDRERRRAH